MVEAFIFDLDGVIVDTAEFHYIAWKKCASDIGIEIDREFNETLKGVSRLESFDRILEHGNRATDFTLEEKEKLANEKNEYYVSLIKEIKPEDTLPKIKELLDKLKERNIKIGLASASKNALMVLESLNLLSYFDFVADAGKCKNSKPAPDIFLMACEGLNVNPKNCIGVEDASSGVCAINSCDMFSVGVGDKEVLNEADLVFENTESIDLEKILERFSQR